MVYQVVLRDPLGITQAVISDYRSLNFVHNLDDVGNSTLVLSSQDPSILAGYWVKDAMIDVQRRIDPMYPILGPNPLRTWYTEWLGLHRTPQYQETSLGTKLFTSYGRSLVDLLRRREIEYYTASAQAAKEGPGDTVATAYVQENCGTLALAARQRPLIICNAAAGTAPHWHGDRAWQNLLQTLQDISKVSQVDFDVYYDFTSQEFHFYTKYPRLGTNRTTTQNVVPPVIFSTHLGNMTDVSYTESATEEVTSLLVLGQGSNAERVTQEVNSPAINDSPYNRIERTYDANTEQAAMGLVTVGERKLQELRQKNVLQFNVLQIPSCIYGIDYFLGDLVTIRFNDIEITQQLTSVSITVSEGKETIKPDFKDIV